MKAGPPLSANSKSFGPAIGNKERFGGDLGSFGKVPGTPALLGWRFLWHRPCGQREYNREQRESEWLSLYERCQQVGEVG